MAEVVHIADIKQRVVATKAKLNAASQDGLQINARLMDLLEAVEKTLLHNQTQIRRQRRIGKTLALIALVGWLATAAFVAERFYGGLIHETFVGAGPGGQSGTAPANTQIADPDPGDQATSLAISGSLAGTEPTDTSTERTAQSAEQPGNSGSASAAPNTLVQDVDDLVLQPDAYQGRDVVVTGSVVRLFERYRLRSEGGLETILVDVDELQQADRAKLEAAVANAGRLGEVRARIEGRIERQDPATFKLRASELVVIE